MKTNNCERCEHNEELTYNDYTGQELCSECTHHVNRSSGFIKSEKNKHEELEIKLLEACEIIAFYADRNNWYKSEGNYYDMIDINDTDKESLIYYGGKRARNFLRGLNK